MRGMGLRALAAGEAKRERPVWGDGLVEQSYSDWWYPTDWGSVDEDELVVFLPSLTRCADRGAGRQVRLQEMLTDRVCVAAKVFFPSDGTDAAFLALVARCGAGAGLEPLERQLSVHGSKHAHDDRSPYLEWMRNWLRLHRDPNQRLRLLCFELAVVHTVNQLLVDGSDTHPVSARAGSEAPTLADALVASLHTSLNAAYVYPQFALAHELFTLGAWLGHLLRGRAALMPPFIAETLADWTSGRQDRDNCRQVLLLHAEIAGGSERLLKLASVVRSGGRPALVKPRRRGFFWQPDPIVWNEQLFKLVGEAIRPA